MKVKELKRHIQDLPDDYDVELCSYVRMPEKDKLSNADEDFIPIDNAPIIGIAKRNEKKEVRFVVMENEVVHFGSGDFAKDDE